MSDNNSQTRLNYDTVNSRNIQSQRSRLITDRRNDLKEKSASIVSNAMTKELTQKQLDYNQRTNSNSLNPTKNQSCSDREFFIKPVISDSYNLSINEIQNNHSTHHDKSLKSNYQPIEETCVLSAYPLKSSNLTTTGNKKGESTSAFMNTQQMNHSLNPDSNEYPANVFKRKVPSRPNINPENSKSISSPKLPTRPSSHLVLLESMKLSETKHPSKSIPPPIARKPFIIPRGKQIGSSSTLTDSFITNASNSIQFKTIKHFKHDTLCAKYSIMFLKPNYFLINLL